MKKILLCSAAIVGVSAFAAPAMAQIDVTIGGHSKNYIGYLDQDDPAAGSVRHFDMIRKSELHINAEGTADNGLVYGFHTELNVDEGDEDNTIKESYLYLASAFGRVNLGSEDGANYLLQVAAPSADANIDGLRQYINPVNYGAGLPVRYDYANDVTGKAEKLTYLSPNWSGFQFGVSYTPDTFGDDGSATGLAGFNFKDDNALEEAYEAGVRYEGAFDNVGFAVGAGYTHLEAGTAAKDMKQWNIGTDFDIGAFGVGAAYTKSSNIGGVDNADSRTWVVGADYTTGPFQFGASYYDNKVDAVGGDLDTKRYTGGVIYTLTQGLTLRGSISYIDHDFGGGADADATSVLGGIQFNF